MKIKHKLAVGFTIMVLLVAVVGIVSLFQLCRVAQPLRDEIPQAVATAARSKHQDLLSQLIRYYDEVLTQSARNFAFTHNPKWEQRYKNAEPKLDGAIKEAMSQGDEKDRELFSSIDKANLALVEMEYRSMQRVNAGRAKEAVAVLDSNEYWDQKDVYQKGLTDYAQRRAHESDDALDASAERIQSANRLAQHMLRAGILLVLGVVIAAVLLSTGIGLAILRSISRPLEQLRMATMGVGRGNLEVAIDVDSNDEIGHLAVSFREMAANLRDTTASIDSLNREIAERQRAEAELLAINKVLASEITHRERAEAERRESEEKFRVLFEVSSDAIMTLEPPTWRFTSGNPATVKMFKVKDEAQFVRQGPWEVSPEFQPDGTRSDDKAKAMIGKAMHEGSNFFEWDHRRTDGEVFPATVLLTRVTLGEKVFLQATVRDITEAKKAEKMLRKSEERFRLALNATQEGIWEWDIRTHQEFFSPRWCEIVGYSFDDPELPHTYDSWTSRIHPDDYDHVTSALNNHLEKGTKYDVDYRHRHKSGEYRWQNSKGQAFFDESGKPAKMVGCISDITERKEAERQQSQLLQQVGEINQELRDFAYVVSHDLKAPLRAIKTLADWFAADYQDKLDEQGRENLQLLGSRVNRTQNLIDGILQYSRVGHTEQGTAPVDLRQIVPEIIENLGVPAHIAIHVEPDLPTVEADVTRITQVFQNLLSNAIKYLDKPQGNITVGCVEEEGFWRFRVSDNGPGIEEKHFERVFKLFQTLAPRDGRESTGVGLTITKKIVEMYGGRIWVESEVGRGSTFFFTFPKKKTVEVRARQATRVTPEAPVVAEEIALVVGGPADAV